MPKRTLSSSSSSALQKFESGSADPAAEAGGGGPTMVGAGSGQHQHQQHVSKFSRISASPPLETRQATRGGGVMMTTKSSVRTRGENHKEAVAAATASRLISPGLSSSSPFTTTVAGAVSAEEEEESDGRGQPSAGCQQQRPIQCLLPPHRPLSFASVPLFEAHLLSHHTNRCASCAANFPSAHLLGLHQAENHDPLLAARRHKGAAGSEAGAGAGPANGSGSEGVAGAGAEEQRIYACLVEGCDKLCTDKWKRRRHVIDKHGWRKDYDWAVVERGLGRGGSLLKGDSRRAESGDAGKARGGRRPSLTGSVAERGVKRNAGFPAKQVERVDEEREVGGEEEQEEEGQHDKGRGSTSSESGEEEDSADGYEGEEDEICSTPTNQSPPFDLPVRQLSSSNARSGTNVAHPGAGDVSMDVLTSSMASLKFVPPSVRRNQALRQTAKKQR